MMRPQLARFRALCALTALVVGLPTGGAQPGTESSDIDSLDEGNDSPPCARALLLVAHPDDETLFAGELLLGRVAALPGGCRNALWHVVCVTNGNIPNRRMDFQRAILMASSHGLAAKISMEIWDYIDCNSPPCAEFLGEGPVPFKERLSLVLSGKTTFQKPWDFVVTHNAQGEYHHMQHIGLHNAVKSLLAKDGAVPGNPMLLVFNPLPELNVSMSVGKRRMANSYLSGRGVLPPRVLLFRSLTKYAEHVVFHEQFPRLDILSLGPFQGAMQQDNLHYSYAWALARYKDWGELGQFSADRAIHFLNELLGVAYQAGSCQSKGGKNAAWYPSTCAKLGRALSAEGLGLQHIKLQALHSALDTLFQEETSDDQAGDASSAEIPQTPNCQKCCAGGVPRAGEDCISVDAACLAHCSPPEGPGQIRCLHWAPPIESIGTVSGWEVVGDGSGQVWMELLMVRPIFVGWRQGYKGKTFRVLGTSGPVLVDMSVGHRSWVPQLGSAIPVLPHDQIAWGVFSNPSESLKTAESPKQVESAIRGAEAMCLGVKGCDDAGLCAFDTPLADIADAGTVAPSQVLPKLLPRQLLTPQKRYNLQPALDISRWLEPSTTYEELMTLRQRLEHPDLQLFEDKIRLRQELLPAVGVRSTPSIHISNSDFNVAPHLQGRRGYVVKPSHMSESQNVFVVNDGTNLLQQAWGFESPRITPEQIQGHVDTFRGISALDWECQALKSARPGVIVEELVLAEDSTGKFRVDEYKFYVAWGEVMFGENVPFSSGAALEIARDGTVVSAVAPCPPMCVAPCYHRMVQLAEQVARGARTDYLRVDFLVAGRCEEMYVSEVELFPASDFSPDLKAKVAERWRWGYGF